MPRSKALPGPSRLSQILKNLNQSPRPYLPTLKALKLTLAARNEHFGARHFVSEDLPRIQYANPQLEVSINKRTRLLGDKWKAELQLEFKNGSAKTMDVSNKWSTAIFEELMDRAGGERWHAYKAARRAAGQNPIVSDAQSNATLSAPPPAVPKRESTRASL